MDPDRLGRQRYARVALPVPVNYCFDYLCAPELPCPEPGMRVRVPLGRRQAVGIVLSLSDTTDAPQARIKPLTEVLDEQPLFDTVSLRLITWAAEYYLEPVGQALHAALPLRLRQGRKARSEGAARYLAKP